MKFRVSQWLDTSDEEAEEFPIKYGIQVKPTSGSDWLHAADRNNKPYIFDTPDEAGEKIEELKAMIREQVPEDS